MAHPGSGLAGEVRQALEVFDTRAGAHVCQKAHDLLSMLDMRLGLV